MSNDHREAKPQQLDMTFDAGLDDLGPWATQVQEGQLYGVVEVETYTTPDGDRRVRLVLRGPVG